MTIHDLPAVTDLLADLIRIDSTSGTPGESQTLEFIAAWFAANGSRSVITKATDTDGNPSGMLVTTPGRAAGPGSAAGTDGTLVFACHVDVVPVADPSVWTTRPFEPTRFVDEQGAERMRGRGSSDMKSGLAAAMIAVARLHTEADGPNVALALSIGEEVGSRGAATVVDLLAGAGVEVGAIVIPESTGNRVVLGHRGALWLQVETAGVAAHGSTPERGRNAIESMAGILTRLDEIPLDAHPELGVETTNVGTIRAGAVPNIVPDRCTVSVDHRVVGADSGRLIEWWRAQPDVDRVTVELDLAPVWTPRDTEWVAGLGAPVSDTPASYFTDASVFVRTMPTSTTPMVVWGPGDPTLVHTVDESVETALVEQAVESFVAAGNRWSWPRTVASQQGDE